MDLIDLGDVGSGCEEKNCGLTSSFQEDCSNNDCHWEEPMFGLIELVCVTVIYIPLMLFGLLGNILTILVVLLRPHMRSSTYLYLSSMAVSDLLILLLLPLDLFKLWKPRPWTLGDLTCKLTMFLSECCTFCTILHITFLSLERYLAVCWPITAKTLVTRRRTRTVIGCLWLGAAVSAAPVLVMVGVEEVGGEELGFSQWREDRGWTGSKGEHGGFRISGGERGSGHMALKDGGIQEIMLGERQTKGWGERVGDLKWFSNDGEDKLRIGDFNERKQGDGGEMTDKIQADEEGGEEEGKVELEEEKPNKKKEDEGGGREGRVDGGLGREIDKRECRCTDYAVSSGLLSAMMILSNLYFLVPLCILGLMYSLIGRTLWLRPKSSRRDQSHRHTVKMLGVIVLAFVLCWLPFHVGRTIFSLSLGTVTDKQETHTDTNSDINTLSDISRDSNDINTHAVTKAFSHMDTHFSEAHSQTGEMNEHTLTERDEIFCEICGKTKVKINTHTDDMDTDTQSFPAVSNTGTGPHDLDPSIKTNTHMETHNDSAHDNTLLRRFADDKIQNRAPICINSQNNQTNHTQPTAGTNTYAAPPTDLYNDNTHNHARFNYTKSHPDTHLYFLYYLSQYFNLVSSVLFYLSAAVNPLLYNLMSARYRHAVHSLLHTHSHTQAYRLRTLTTQQSTTTL